MKMPDTGLAQSALTSVFLAEEVLSLSAEQRRVLAQLLL